MLHDEGADLGSFLPLLQIASGFCVNSREASYAVPGNPRGEQHGPAAVLRNEVKTPFDVLVPQASHEGHEVISPLRRAFFSESDDSIIFVNIAILEKRGCSTFHNVHTSSLQNVSKRHKYVGIGQRQVSVR